MNKILSNNDVVCNYYHHSTFISTYIHTHTANVSKILYWGGFHKHCTTPQDTAINIFFFSVSEDDLNGPKHFEPRVSKRSKNILTSLWTCNWHVTYDGWKTKQQAQECWIKQAAICSTGTFESLTSVTQTYQQPSHLKSNLRFNYQGKSHYSAISPTAT